MAENLPSSSGSSRQPPLGSSDESHGHSLRWSLQNFPVPVQLQARIPRSPLAVAQELLPNFPSHLLGSEESTPSTAGMSNHQIQLAIQQQAQQQLQQQLQRQLQLNLQGGGESSRRSILPDPPDTTLDIDLPGRPPISSGNTFASSSSSSSGPSSSVNDSGHNWTTRAVGSGLRSALNSAHFSALEALFRNPQSGSVEQRSNAGSETGRSSRHSSQLLSQVQSGSHLHAHSHSHNHHHHLPPHPLSDAQPPFDSVGVAGSNVGAGDGVSNVPSGDVTQQLVPGNGVAPGGSGGNNGAADNANGAEVYLLIKWLAESGIFVVLLLLHFLYDHRLGLLVFLCTGGTFYYTNMRLVHAIHQSAVREQTRSWFGFLNLLWLSTFLMANVIILYYVFAEEKLWRLLYYQMATVPDVNVWTLLWCVVMTDYIIKFVTVAIKAVLAMMQPCFRNYRHRGKYYLLIESVSQLYRQSVTIVPWLYYLNDSTRTSFWFAFLTEAAYLGFKGLAVWGSVQFVYSSFQRFQSNTAFGSKPGSSDLLERGNQCPICQDSFNDPLMLPCKHIFCERCVSIWFDREKTCPMCRAQIMVESPRWKDGSTSAHILWH